MRCTSGAKIMGARLWDANLICANLADADMRYSDLTSADLMGENTNKSRSAGSEFHMFLTEQMLVGLI